MQTIWNLQKNVICAEKHVLKNVYKWAKRKFAIAKLSWKDSSWSWNTDSLVKKKFQVLQSVKIFWGIKRAITIDFFEKVATVNSSSYCQKKFTLYIEWTLYIYMCVCKVKLGSCRHNEAWWVCLCYLNLMPYYWYEALFIHEYSKLYIYIIRTAVNSLLWTFN